MLKALKFKILLLAFVHLLTLRAIGQERCDTLIVNGIEKMQHEQYRESIKLLLEAKKLAEKNTSYRHQFLANNNIGANYFAILDYGEALKYYMEAYKIAVAHLDESYRMTALNNIAILYSKEHNYEKALNYFTIAYNYALSQNSDEKAGLYLMNIGILAYEKREYPKAYSYVMSALKKVKRESDILMIKLTMARIKLRQDKIGEARENALAILKRYRNSEFKDLLINVKIVLAESYVAQSKYQMAIDVIFECLTEVVNPETKSELFNLLSSTYEKSGSYKQALVYRDSVRNNELKIVSIRDENAFQHDKLRFEIEDYKTREHYRDVVIASQRKIFLITIFLIVIIVLALLVVIRTKFQKKKLLSEKKEQEVLLELEQQKNEKLQLEKDMQEKDVKAAFEKEELNLAVQARNKELSIKAFSLSKRNELVEEIIDTFSKIPEFSGNHLFINYLKRLKKEVSSSEEWDDFTRHFNELNYEFIRKLKDRHPGLTKNDVRFIIYIYMNLTTKEISNLLGITSESARKRKERIALKIGLNSSRLLYNYLMEL